MTYRGYLLLFFLGGTFSLHAQESCMQELKGIFRQVHQSAEAASPGKTCYMSYSVKPVMKDSAAHPAVESTIELWKKGKLMEIRSSDMQVYQDEREAFIVIPSKKLIMRNDAVSAKSHDLQKQYSILQDTLLKCSRVQSCLARKGKGFNKTIMLLVNERGQAMLGIQKAEYDVDTEAALVRNIRVYYTENSPANPYQDLLYTQYSFHQTSYDHKGKTLSSSVENKFMKNKAGLKESYKGFTLVDNRKQAPERR